jgi:hypothetical protein
MSTPDRKSPESLPAEPAFEPAAADAAQRSPRPREIGGPAGPEPTRFGDWEKNGRCIDF